MTNYVVFETGPGKLAIGVEGQLAKYVIRTSGEKPVAVRGRRPMLTKGKYKRVKFLTKKIQAAFAAFLSE